MQPSHATSTALDSRLNFSTSRLKTFKTYSKSKTQAKCKLQQNSTKVLQGMIVPSKCSNPVKFLYDFMSRRVFYVAFVSSFSCMLTKPNCSISTYYALCLCDFGCDFNNNFMPTSSGHRLNSPRIYMKYIQLHTASISKDNESWALEDQDQDWAFKIQTKTFYNRILRPRLKPQELQARTRKCNSFTYTL